jgi:Holliday junction resolvase
MRESQIQSKVITELERKGYYVIKLIQTNKNGIPDLMAIKDGKVVFIEVKVPGKKPKVLQAYRHAELKKYGANTITATNTNDITDL